MPPVASDRGQQLAGVDVHTPVVAIHGGEGLARAHGAESVGVGVRLAQVLGKRLRIVDAFGMAQVLEEGLLVGDEAARIGHLRVGIAGTEVVDGQPLGLRDGTQLGQRRRHLAGYRHRLLGQVGGDER